MNRSAPPGPRLRAVLIVIAVGAVVLPATVVVTAPPVVAARTKAVLAQRQVVPPTALPPVEPVEFVDLPPDEARAFNAGVPFARGPNPAARAFRLADAPADLARATDCLATAVLYEAGADPAGQRAVAQVVLNRVRHPAFPATVCGVVFEGRERRTGCQFSFACDGALTRWSPPASLWAAARKVATAALSGAVYRPIGYATHYHTDWVVPYWQSSLDKVAKVGTHLFFRWTGWWGTPGAFSRRSVTSEPTIAAIAAFSDAHRDGTALAQADAALDEAAALVAEPPRPLATDPDTFFVTLPGGLSPDGWPALAMRACGERPRCRFSAWYDAARTPAAAPLTPDQVSAMSFSYLRDTPAGLERTLWNCRIVLRASPRDCMRQQVLLTASPGGAIPTTPSFSGPRGPAALDGIRRASPLTPLPPTASGSAPRGGTAFPPSGRSPLSQPPPLLRPGAGYSPATDGPARQAPDQAHGDGRDRRSRPGAGRQEPAVTPPGTSPPAAP